MESLSKISAPSTDVQQLRKFYDSCESNIRALEMLGVQTDSYGISPILINSNSAKEVTGTITLYNIQNKFSGRLLPK